MDGIYSSFHAGVRAVLSQYAGQGDGKPSPALLHRACHELNLTLDGAWMVGDSIGDIQTALNAGIAPIAVRTGNGKNTELQLKNEHPDVPVADDLSAAVDLLLA